MLRNIQEFETNVLITGFRGVNVEDAKTFLNFINNELSEDVEIQLFDADLVATWQHLYFAAINALNVFETKHNISKALRTEIALYASSQCQIKKALDFIGIRPGCINVAVIIVSKIETSAKSALSALTKYFVAEPDETVLDVPKIKIALIKKAFDISCEEFESLSEKNSLEQALVNLVIERVALLSTDL